MLTLKRYSRDILNADPDATKLFPVFHQSLVFNINNPRCFGTDAKRYHVFQYFLIFKIFFKYFGVNVSPSCVFFFEIRISRCQHLACNLLTEALHTYTHCLPIFYIINCISDASYSAALL